MFQENRFTLCLAGLLTFFLAATPFSQSNSGTSQELRFALKHDLVAQINRDRAASGLSPVQLDPEASAIADAYCERQIREKTTGHFSLDGQSPYMRYSFSGGNDGVSENAAAWSANYTFSESTIPDLMSKSQNVMVTERPPHDGHKKTILDPYATHVGIGLAWRDGEFRLAEEFVRRYLDWSEPLPRTATVNQRIACAGKPLPGFKVVAASVHYEDFPQAMSPQLVNTIDSYSLPKARKDYLPQSRELSSDATRLARYVARNAVSPGQLIIRKDGSFNFVVPFEKGAGVYTVVVWVKPDGSSTPIPASNVSMRIERFLASPSASPSVLGSR